MARIDGDEDYEVLGLGSPWPATNAVWRPRPSITRITFRIVQISWQLKDLCPCGSCCLAEAYCFWQWHLLVIWPWSKFHIIPNLELLSANQTRARCLTAFNESEIRTPRCRSDGWCSIPPIKWADRIHLGLLHERAAELYLKFPDQEPQFCVYPILQFTSRTYWRDHTLDQKLLQDHNLLQRHSLLGRWQFQKIATLKGRNLVRKIASLLQPLNPYQQWKLLEFQPSWFHVFH